MAEKAARKQKKRRLQKRVIEPVVAESDSDGDAPIQDRDDPDFLPSPEPIQKMEDYRDVADDFHAVTAAHMVPEHERVLPAGLHNLGPDPYLPSTKAPNLSYVGGESSDEILEDEVPEFKTNIEHEDLKKGQVRRRGLEKIFLEPYFSDFVKGLYVRLCLGESSQGLPIYQIHRVEGVEKYYRSYRFGRNQSTKLALRLSYGSTVRVYKMILVSNQSFTPDDFANWKDKMKKDIAEIDDKIRLGRMLQIPDRSGLNQLILNRKAIPDKFRYTNTHMANMQKSRQDAIAVKAIVNLPQEKIRVKNALEHAEFNNDTDKISFFKRRIEEITQERANRLQRRREKQSSQIYNDIELMNKRALESDRRDQIVAARARAKRMRVAANSGLQTASAFERSITLPESEVFNRSLRREEKAEKQKTEEASTKETPALKMTTSSLDVGRKRRKITDNFEKDSLWSRLHEVCKSFEPGKDAFSDPQLAPPESWMGRVMRKSNYGLEFVYKNETEESQSAMSLSEYLESHVPDLL